MIGFDTDTFVPLLIFAIPIVAIVGGITAGIIRTLGQQRLIELAQRERIAAIERGVDPSKLPPMPIPGDDRALLYHSYADYQRRRSHGLMIGGLVTLAVGLSLAVFLSQIHDTEEHGVWLVGLIPASVGVALLVSAWLVRPHDNGAGSGAAGGGSGMGSGSPPRVG